MENNGAKKQDWWAPDTPSKPSHTRQRHNVDVGDGSPVKLISGELNGKNQASENGSCVAPVPSNSLDRVLPADGADNLSTDSPRCK